MEGGCPLTSLAFWSFWWCSGCTSDTGRLLLVSSIVVSSPSLSHSHSFWDGSFAGSCLEALAVKAVELLVGFLVDLESQLVLHPWHLEIQTWEVAICCHFDTWVAVFVGIILGGPHSACELQMVSFSCGVDCILEFTHSCCHLGA